MEATDMRRTLTALVLGVLTALPAAAQTADDVIAKHMAAVGGLAKLQAVKSVRMTGRITLGPGVEAPMVLEIKRPRSLRLDFTVQDMVGSQGYDGTKAWMLMPFTGSKVPQEMSADEASMFEEQADIDGPLVDYKAKGNTVELLGKEKVEGSDTYKLKVTLKSGAIRTFYLDADTFLEIKEEGKRMLRGTEMETETIVGDYKQVDGLMMPHALDSGVKGTPRRQKIVVEKIELNVPIDDARFKMPDVK
jgi:hypothetical protein